VSACEYVEVPGFVLEFVSKLIDSGLSANPRERSSFHDISGALEENCFTIADSVDSDEILAFVDFVQS
jgi:hypothetical protein